MTLLVPWTNCSFRWWILMLLYAVILFAPACIHTFICLKMLSQPNAEEGKSRDRYPVSKSFACKSLMIFYKNSVFHVNSPAPILTSHVLIILICRYLQRHLTPKPFRKRRTPYFTGLLHFLPGLLRNMIFLLKTLALFSRLRLSWFIARYRSLIFPVNLP